MSAPTAPTGSNASPELPDPAASLYRVFGDRPFCADGDVLALALAADGSFWSVEEPGILRHWNTQSGHQIEWHYLTELATVWAFHPDGRLLASGSDELMIWDVSTCKPVSAFGVPSWITSVAFRPEAGVIATGHDDGIVRTWNLTNGELLQELEGHRRPISALAFRPDGSVLASASEDKAIGLWELSTGRLRDQLLGHTDRIPALAWHPDGSRLYSAGWDTTVRVWDAQSAQPIILLNAHVGQVAAMALSPDGLQLTAADSLNTLHVWDLGTNRPRHLFKGHRGEVRCLAYSADGNRLVSGGSDRVLAVWDPVVGQRRSTSADPAFFRTGVAVSPDGTQLAGIGGAALRVWKVASGELLCERQTGEALHAVAFSPDGRCIATGGSGLGISLWDAATGKLQRTLEGQATPIAALAFSPDGKSLASCTALGNDVWLWDLDSGQPLLILPDAAEGCAVEALSFHPQGHYLAVAGVDWLQAPGTGGAVAVWDLGARRPLFAFPGGATAVAFDPSGRFVAAAALTETIQIFDVSAERLVGELSGHEGPVTSVAYAADGRLLASGGDDQTVRLWDAATGQALTVTEMDTQIKGLCFSPDSRYLYTGNGNTSCYQLQVAQML